MYVVYEERGSYSGDANGARHNCYLKTSSPLSILSSLEIELDSSNFYHFPCVVDVFEENTYVPVMFKMSVCGRHF